MKNLIEQKIREIFIATVSNDKTKCYNIAQELLEIDIVDAYYILKSIKEIQVGFKPYRDFAKFIETRGPVDFDLFYLVVVQYSERLITHQTNQHKIFHKIVDELVSTDKTYHNDDTLDAKYPDLKEYTLLADKIFEHYEELKCKN